MFASEGQREFERSILQHEARTSTVPQTVREGSMLRKTSGLTRSKTFLAIDTSNVSVVSSTSSSTTASSCLTERSASSYLVLSARPDVDSAEFSSVLRDALQNTSSVDHHKLRRILEPYLRQARLRREDVMPSSNGFRDSIHLPYPCLRHERRFLFDEHTFPLHQMLSEALNVPSLADIDSIKDKDLLLPLESRAQRRQFHTLYDAFVTSFCIPLLHANAISKQVVNTSDRITYRYQAFPDIRISRPGKDVSGQILCDLVRGYSPACLTFYVPLTPCDATNCLYTESHPGREDWHPLNTKSVGLGYLFDGSRCLQFCLPNTSSRCSVALVFRVALLLDDEYPDAFTKTGQYYDTAVVDARHNDVVVKENPRRLLDPDYRHGYPFV